MNQDEVVTMSLQQKFLYQSDMIFMLHVVPGGRLNKKDGLTRYGDSHVKDKTS